MADRRNTPKEAVNEDMINLLSRFFNVTKLYRVWRGLTQMEVAEKAGCPQMTVWALEKYGLSDKPAYREQQEAILAFYGKSAVELGASFPSHLSADYSGHREKLASGGVL